MSYRLLLLLVCVAVTSCGRPAENVFGRSYDECVLKNVSHGTEALDACVRHFEREAKPWETYSVQGKAVAIYTGTGDGAMFMDVQNRAPALMVTAISVAIPFHKEPPDVQPVTLEHQEWSHPAEQTLTWTFSTRLRPNENARLQGTVGWDSSLGTFTGDGAPRATRVVDLGPPPPKPFDIRDWFSGG